MWRSIVLELGQDGVPQLLTLVEADRAHASNLHEALRRTVRERNNQILYANLLPVPGEEDVSSQAGSGDCCRAEDEEILR